METRTSTVRMLAVNRGKFELVMEDLEKVVQLVLMKVKPLTRQQKLNLTACSTGSGMEKRNEGGIIYTGDKGGKKQVTGRHNVTSR